MAAARVSCPQRTHWPCYLGAGEDGFEWAPGRGPIVGTCEEMCPAAERARREGMNDIQAGFEEGCVPVCVCVGGGGGGWTSASLRDLPLLSAPL
jgi:hypothetical protein